MWTNGLNFSQTRYKIIDGDSFIPYLRSSHKTAIPRAILEKFPGKEIALVEITDGATGKKHLRIKKLFAEGNSKTVSMKAEKGMQNLQIRVLNVVSEREALSREGIGENFMRRFIPTYTNARGRGSPIYAFDSDNKLVVGGYYKKDIIMGREIVFDDDALSAIGLYFADGGKTAATFTNVWPDAINCVLSFFERFFGLNRETVKATICCSNELKDRKDGMERFWKSQTGISNFAKTLHFNKNVKSAQGIMELYFCSEVMKEAMLRIMDFAIHADHIDKTAFIRGVLSGDGSPIQQTAIVLNHQITFDEKSRAQLDRIFSGFKTRIVRTQPRKVICTGWRENKEFMLSDPYRFNRLNRVRFAKRFLLLPRTAKENDVDVIKFKEITYPSILNSLLEHYRILNEFGLINEDVLGRVKDEYNIC
jgi:hypothetical protein